jgi:hypothetical protein
MIVKHGMEIFRGRTITPHHHETYMEIIQTKNQLITEKMNTD